MNKTKKPTIAIVSLTDDEGCSFAILELGKKFFDLAEYFNIGEFRLIEEEREKKRYDITFVQGSVVTQKNHQKVKELRKKSKVLVAIGACAHLGGIPEIKNYGEKEKLAEKVYRFHKSIDNPEIKPLRELVKVDFELPGCPITPEEFLKFLRKYLQNQRMIIPARPVCYECQIAGYRCLLQNGKPCLGPITLGGCYAVCLKAGFQCEGCRGLVPGINPRNHLQKLQTLISQKRLKEILETYGLRDDLEEALQKSQGSENKAS